MQRAEFGRRANEHMCSVTRASCRKFVALRNKIADRGNRKGIRSAKRER